MPDSMENFHSVMALRRSLAILTDDRPAALMEESQADMDGPSIDPSVMPAASIFRAVLRRFAAYPRLTSFPEMY
jgi:hypothetical protein